MRVPWWLLSLLLAVLVRLLLLAQVDDYVLFRVPLIDAEEYVAWASRLALGGGELSDVYYKAPLYPWMLAAWIQLLGVGARAIAAFNLCLGIANVLLLGVWCRRIVGPRWGTAAAFGAAMFAPMLLFEIQALPATLSLTFATLSLLLLDRLRLHWSAWVFVAAALSLGLGCLVRPTLLLWVPVAMSWFWQVQRRRAASRRRAALRSILWGVCVLMVVLPVTLRNRQVGGEWVLISANGGINLFLGNNADAAHTMRMRSGMEWEVLVSSIPHAERQGQARWDRWFRNQSLHWIADHPADFLVGLGRKSLEYLNAHRIDRNLDSRGFESQSSLLRWAPGMGWLAPWLLLGYAVALRRGGAARLAAVFALTMFLATILVFVAERYKLDALAGLLPLALLGVRELLAQIRRRAMVLPVGVVLVLLVAGSLLAFGNWVGIRNLQPAHAATLEGVALYKERNWPAALARLRQAVSAQPGDADAHLTLGTTWQQLGRLPEALQSYERAHELVPMHPRPLLNRGWIQREQGNLEAARASFEAVLELDPRSARGHLELATVLELQGDRLQAVQHYFAAERNAQDPRVAQMARQRAQALRR